MSPLKLAGSILPLLAVMFASLEPVNSQEPEETLGAESFTTLAEGVELLDAPGANVLVAEFGDELLVVDTDFSRNAPSVVDAIKLISKKRIKYVVNTHHHKDHAGGSAVFAENGAQIVSHDNARRRSLAELAKSAELAGHPEMAPRLPYFVYSQQAELFDDKETTVRLIHPGAAHTDGDTIVFFVNRNIIHMGDLFFNGGYPFIDLDGGGDLDGYIAAQELALSLANDETIIVPSHGPLADKARLEETVRMLRAARRNVSDLIESGLSEQEIIDANPLSDFNDDWGSTFYPPDAFVRMLFRALDEGGAVSAVRDL